MYLVIKTLIKGNISMRNNTLKSKSERLINSVLILSAITLVVGCNEKETGEKNEKKATQVAVKVNDSEITVHQVNQVLQSSGGQLPANAANKIVEGLIDQELLVQKAISNHLDRDPNIVMALENARRQVLSQSYIQKQVLDKTPIDSNTKQEYFDKNANLFSKRRVYQFQVFSLDIPKLDSTLSAGLENLSKPEQVKELLNKNSIKFEEEAVTKPAEQLPIEMLDTFAKAKIGDIILLPQPQPQSKVLLMQVVNFIERPVTFKQAENQIEQFLVTTRNKEKLESHLKQLRSVAQITYEGDFAKKDKEEISSSPVENSSTADKKPEVEQQKILESGFK